MPIITVKYAPPSAVACANVRLTAESHRVSVASNSCAALSHSQIDLPSKCCCTHNTDRDACTNVFLCSKLFCFFCRLNTLLHMILCACLVNFSFQPTKPAHNLTADVFNKTHIDKNWCLIWREPDFFHFFRFASYLPLCWKYMKMQRIKRHYAFFFPFRRNPLTTVLTSTNFYSTYSSQSTYHPFPSFSSHLFPTTILSPLFLSTWQTVAVLRDIAAQTDW